MLVESISALTDAFAADIYYHKHCWMQYVVNTQMRKDEEMHLQGVSYSEMQTLFLRKVDEIIFTDHEIRSLQSLLQEYKDTANEYGFTVGDLKSSYLKEILVKEFGEAIGFKSRAERNRSELVFDTNGSGDYVESAMSSLGITDEQLLRNLAPRLSQKIRSEHSLNFPPRIDQLEDDENLSTDLLKLLYWMKNPEKSKSFEDDPLLTTLGSLITYYVTGKRTSSAISIAVLLHGMTRSKELVEMLHESGLCASYKDVLLLYDTWALIDAEETLNCPPGIADDEPAIVIFDNDNFPIDTITGNASGAHRTNVMFVQPENLEEVEGNQPDLRLRKKNFVASKLREVCSNLTDVKQYVCPPGSYSIGDTYSGAI